MDDELYLLSSQEEINYAEMTIVEGSEDKRPGVLCTVEGPFMVFCEDNNNDRWYTTSLAKNRILGIPYTKKMLENSTLYGEASHPKDRFDVLLTLISHCITALWFNEDETILMGRADILDTPSGRIIYTLIKYGSKIGVSVRARGRLVMKNGKRTPEEKSYQFKTFDFVPNPGFDEARVQAINESEDTDIVQGFMDFVNNASVQELKCVQPIFESANDEVLGSVKEVLEKRLSGDTMSQELDEDSASALYEEIVKGEERIAELEDLADTLRGQLNESEGTVASLNREISTLKHDIGLKDKDIEDKDSRLQALLESESSLKDIEATLSSRVKRLVSFVKNYRGVNAGLQQRLDESEGIISTLREDMAGLQQRLDESEEFSDGLEDLSGTKVEKLRSKTLPQGRSQVLNESLVDIPQSASSPVKDESMGRMVSFITKCGK